MNKTYDSVRANPRSTVPSVSCTSHIGTDGTVWSGENNPFATLSESERVAIVRYLRPRYRRGIHTEAVSLKYSREWFDSTGYKNADGSLRYGDLSNLIVNLCAWPERSRSDYVYKAPVTQPLDFFSEVSSDAATRWYKDCPEHLRKKVDTELSKIEPAESAKFDSEFYQLVFKTLGHRPDYPWDDSGELSSYFQFEEFSEWVRLYDQLALINTVLRLAPSIQSERKMLMQALGHSGGGTGLPQQAAMEGIDDVQAATIRWLQVTGITPLERLAEIYRSDNPAIKISDQIAAASKLMEYVHKKVPVKTEVKTDTAATPEVSPELFSKLNSKELTLLKELMRKMREGQGE